jgi:hypothetical protein
MVHQQHGTQQQQQQHQQQKHTSKVAVTAQQRLSVFRNVPTTPSAAKTS